MDKKQLIYNEIKNNLLDSGFLKEVSMTKQEMSNQLESAVWFDLALELDTVSEKNGRFNSEKVFEVLNKHLDLFHDVPNCGWVKHCYNWSLFQLFPELITTDENVKYRKGTAYILQILRALYDYERKTLPFDPTYNFFFLLDSEIEENGYNQEYIKLHRLVKSKYIYEFMRIGVDLTPFNTLGHIGGVHYVAMYVARQLAKAGAPIDLGLVSGAAAGHDIGKYGCKKTEEKRIPYLHYYYTDLCYSRFELPTIGHIAANHSTWDLELENLSVESLVLIYADFRVKSYRDGKGVEKVNFYSLKDAFDVILNKLDNVDYAKEMRYRKVYSKLKDFEDYMIEKGVETDLPSDFSPNPKTMGNPKKREMVLLDGEEIIRQIKFKAVDHNITLMSKFHIESEFANLIEAARSERQWKNLRTYVNIFGEYSTYMTEKQKIITIKFLYELLSHKEGDIRSQAADIMGYIIGNFSDEYSKELPEGISFPQKPVNNLTLWEEYLEKIIHPDHKLTDQHKKWITGSLTFFVPSVLHHCKKSCRGEYIRILGRLYGKEPYHVDLLLEILTSAQSIDPEENGKEFNESVLTFAKTAAEHHSESVKIAALKCERHFSKDIDDKEYYYRLRKIMGIKENIKDLGKSLSNMFLDDLKTGTPWVVKVANINFMLEYLKTNKEQGNLLHVATHLTNLVKVSETVTVRKAAGKGLLAIIGQMPPEQRNELTVELFNGLEIGDYQFSKYIPEYLGIIMLYLPPKELDESIDELKKVMETGNEMVASSVIKTLGVMVSNYHIYKKKFKEDYETSEKRRFRCLNLIIKAFAGFDVLSSQEAFWTLGVSIFGSKEMSMDEKTEVFTHSCKKLITLIHEKKEGELDFLNNAAVLNNIYRFITEHQSTVGDFKLNSIDKVAFFPGTFDPFSLGHKAVATTIRNLGFEVYLALDEFSWSKNTQPRLQRRKIMTMSIADEDDLYVFPEDIPVNIANPRDIKALKEVFSGKELYIAVGTDVIKNASSYKAMPEENSIHTLNHIAFARESDEQKMENASQLEGVYPITGKVINLRLKKYYEDISSTRIRENIDLNRDISNIIDPVAQNYIYDRNLYLRQPAYKHVIQAKNITISSYKARSGQELIQIKEEMTRRGYSFERVSKYLEGQKVRALFIESGSRTKKKIAFAAAHRVETSQLLDEFQSTEIAAHIREMAEGGIAVIGAMFVSSGRTISSVNQILITEILTELLSRDFAFAIYNPVDEAGYNSRVIEALKKQGFVNIAGNHSNHPVYAVNMKSPAIIFKDVETVIKDPLNKNPQVLKAIEEAHNRLLRVMTDIKPGHLVLSFNTSAVHNKIIDKVAELNGVSTEPNKTGEKGLYMSVPFGKALADVVVPNTVTKALNTEKYFDSNFKDFTIGESKHYSSIDNQAKTIKSFNRPIILIDDLLHKSYRMNIIDPILKQNNVQVKEIIVGVLTGQARDLMNMKGRQVESAYFLPTLSVWLNERDSYPFIGGDSLGKEEEDSVNLLLPYTVPDFIGDGNWDHIYDYSLACLENARDILKVLEREYQRTFEKTLTLKRLGEVISFPRKPALGEGVRYDENLAPSVYVGNDIMRLVRIKGARGNR